MRMIAIALCLILIAADANAQCGAGGCGAGGCSSGGMGFSQGFFPQFTPSFSAYPQYAPAPAVASATPKIEWKASVYWKDSLDQYVDGRYVASVHKEGWWLPAAAVSDSTILAKKIFSNGGAVAKLECDCGCDENGICTCPVCVLAANKALAKASDKNEVKPVSKPKPAFNVVDTKDLTEVGYDPEMGLYQDKDKNLYYLRRDKVASSSGVVPAGKWTWTASK